MKAIKCDRCGEYLTPSPDNKYSIIVGWNVIVDPWVLQQDQKDFSVELCGKCNKELRTFLNNTMPGDE